MSGDSSSIDRAQRLTPAEIAAKRNKGATTHRRKKFLIGAAGTAVLAVAGAVGVQPFRTADQVAVGIAQGAVDVAQNVAKPVVDALFPESNKPLPEVYTGSITIRKGANVRTEKTTTDPNSVPLNWDAIRNVNGQDLNGASGFVIKDPEVEKGFNPDTGELGTGNWVKFQVVEDQGFNVGTTKTAYVYWGNQTADYVTADGQGSLVEEMQGPDGGIFAMNGQNRISSGDIGKTTLLPAETSTNTGTGLAVGSVTFESTSAPTSSTS
jgi:hypothetical protein